VSRDFHFSFNAHILKGISLAISEIKKNKTKNKNPVRLNISASLFWHSSTAPQPAVLSHFLQAFIPGVNLLTQNNADH